MPEKCTRLSLIAQVALLAQFEEGLSQDEEEQARGFFDQYLFYHTRGSRRTCLCTSCCNLWEEQATRRIRWKHNEPVRCPQCNAIVTLKALGRLGRNGSYPSLHEEHNLVVFRAGTDGALLISAGRIAADYEPGGFDGWNYDEILWPVPTMAFYERRRYYLSPGTVLSWKRRFGTYKSIFGMYLDESPWESCASAGEPNPTDSVMSRKPDDGSYRVLGWEALDDTRLRYSAVEQYFSPDKYFFRGVVSYLARYAMRPQMEMLVKLGHTELIDRMLEQDNVSGRLVNWRAKSPHAFFRLSKSGYRLWVDTGGSLDLLPVVRALPDRMPEQQRRRLVYAKSFGNQTLRRVMELGKAHGIGVDRLLDYLKSDRRGLMWVDYLEMGGKLGLDFGRQDVLLPKDLEARHDNALAQIKLERDKEAQEAYAPRKRQLKRKYAFEAEGLLIRVPASAEEIRQEGKALVHCVGGYAPRHMEGRTTILFLRTVEDPDTPLCTIEINGSTIVQIHGYCNDCGARDPRDKYKAFLDLWLAWVEAGSRRDKQGRPVLPGKQEVKTA